MHQAPSSPAVSAVEIVVDNDEDPYAPCFQKLCMKSLRKLAQVSSTHLAEVCDEPAADVILVPLANLHETVIQQALLTSRPAQVSPQSNKTLLGPRAVEVAAQRGKESKRFDRAGDLQLLFEMIVPEELLWMSRWDCSYTKAPPNGIESQRCALRCLSIELMVAEVRHPA